MFRSFLKIDDLEDSSLSSSLDDVLMGGSHGSSGLLFNLTPFLSIEKKSLNRKKIHLHLTDSGESAQTQDVLWPTKCHNICNDAACRPSSETLPLATIYILKGVFRLDDMNSAYCAL